MSKSAIDAPRLNAFLIEPEKLTIVTDKDHPLFDERVHLPIDDRLVHNIMAFGVRQVVTVRKNGDAIEVVDGRQRVRHAIEANKRLAKEGKETIRVRILPEKGTDADLFGVTCFLNEHRQDDNVMGKANKAQRLLNMGKTEDEVCLTFGITRQTLGNWQRLLEASPKVQEAVATGTVSPSAAAAIAKLPREEQPEKLKELVAAAPTAGKRAGKVSARAAKQAASGKERPNPKELRRTYEYLKDADHGLGADAGVAAGILAWVLGECSAKTAGLDLKQVQRWHENRADEAKQAKKAKKGEG